MRGLYKKSNLKTILRLQTKSNKAHVPAEATKQILHKHLLSDSDDYHRVAKELISKIESLISADGVKLNSKLNSMKERFNKIIEYQKGEYKLQGDKCIM